MGMKVAILLTVFNRREKTLECLDICYRQIDAMKSEGTYDFQIYMVDDGSSDGTSDAVRETFPQTSVIRGDGGLYWNQGMRLAWDTAALQHPDFYIWINDDTFLRQNALRTLMETSSFLKHRAIVAGSAEDSAGRLSYGGRTKYGKLVTPDPTIPVPCFTFNGNIVLIPSYVYRILGNLDEHYQHGFGDYDCRRRHCTGRSSGHSRRVQPQSRRTCLEGPEHPSQDQDSQSPQSEGPASERTVPLRCPQPRSSFRIAARTFSCNQSVFPEKIGQ